MFTSWGVTPPDLGRAITFNVADLLARLPRARRAALAARDPIALPPPGTPVIATTRPLGVAVRAARGRLSCLVGVRAHAAPARLRRSSSPGAAHDARADRALGIDWSLAARRALRAAARRRRARLTRRFVGIFLLAQVVGLVSHVPAGLGVFETVMVLLLAPWLPGDVVLGSALAYRIVYYLIPLAVALVLFAGFEAARSAARALRAPARCSRSWAARARAARLRDRRRFAAGVAPARSRARRRRRRAASQCSRACCRCRCSRSRTCSAAWSGVGLLLLARALQQRVDAAYGLTLALLVGGAVALAREGSRLGGGERAARDGARARALPALLLPAQLADRAVVLARAGSPRSALHPDRHRLRRAARLPARRVLRTSSGGSSRSTAHAPRSLRALAGGRSLLAAFALARLLRPARRRSPPPELDEDSSARRSSSRRAPRASAHLALVGDKRAALPRVAAPAS